ncbi:hypothetical protein [Natronorubrum tibetense]|nr:hypothetical protein [Natronorubrum tibetense]
MTDDSDDSEPSPPAEQSPPVPEAMTTEWFVDHLEELDAHVARLLESIPETEAFDDETRARTRRRLREIRAQINPLLITLRSRVDTDDRGSGSESDDPPLE